MGKVFKSAKKIVKKAAPVIGGAVGFAVAGPAGAAIGSGIGGLAGGHGVGKSLMYAAGAYGLSSLAVGAGLGAAAGAGNVPGFMTAAGNVSGSVLQGGAGSGLFSGIMGGLKSLPGNIMRGATNFMGGQRPGAVGVDPRNVTPSGVWDTGRGSGGVPVTEDPGKFSLVKGLFNKLNSPLGVFGATTALGYLGAKQKPETDPVAEAKRMMSGYQSPTDIKYGTKFSSAPGQKVKGLFWNPSTLQYQDQPVAVAAKGGIMSMSDFPRKTGQISGPGTETSDSVPALLSDGEFVMTAKAVRGMGNGSRREGAKRMYELMNQSERRAVA